MRISIDKVAKDMSYNEIINQIKSLDKRTLANITEDKWKKFLEKMNKGNSGTKQLSLFEITANQPSLSPTSVENKEGLI